jgi:hypothetical protein
VLWVSALSFIHRPSKRGQSRVEVVANAPGVLLLAIDADGQVVVHTAADTFDEAVELLELLESRDDIGEAVRLLVERGTEPEREDAA